MTHSNTDWGSRWSKEEWHVMSKALNSIIRQKDLGHSNTHRQYAYHLDQRQFSFFPQTVKDWNSLPPETVHLHAPSTDTFILRVSDIQQPSISSSLLSNLCIQNIYFLFNLPIFFSLSSSQPPRTSVLVKNVDCGLTKVTWKKKVSTHINCRVFFFFLIHSYSWKSSPVPLALTWTTKPQRSWHPEHSGMLGWPAQFVTLLTWKHIHEIHTNAAF